MNKTQKETQTFTLGEIKVAERVLTNLINDIEEARKEDKSLRVSSTFKYNMALNLKEFGKHVKQHSEQIKDWVREYADLKDGQFQLADKDSSTLENQLGIKLKEDIDKDKVLEELEEQMSAEVEIDVRKCNVDILPEPIETKYYILLDFLLFD
jgi:hypothetical protein